MSPPSPTPAPAPAPAPVVDPNAPPTPADPVIPTEITEKDLGAIITKAVEECTEPQMKELKDQMVAVERKAIFPSGNGPFGTSDHEMIDKSIVDTSFFTKQFGQTNTGNAWQDAHNFGMQFIHMGGPFKRLSPEMETLAEIVRCRGKLSKVMGKKIDVLESNHKVFEQLTKVGAITDGTKQAGMSEGVLADGGALVPIAFPAMIIEFATQQSPILSRVWRFPMTTNVMRIPRLQQAAGNYFGGITLYSPDEGELKQDTQPALQRLEFNARKLIGLIYLTDELIADSAINIINYVTALTLRAFQYNLENRVINATGVGPMMGILNAAGITTVARAGVGAISYNDVINLDSVIDENIQNLVWMTRKASQNTLMRLVDLNNRPIFMADYAVFAGQPAHPNTMISYPVYRTRNVPALGTNGDLILGDLSWYMLAIRQDMTVDMSEHVRFIYDEQTLRFVMRLDGQPVVPAAFTYLVGPSGS